MKAQWTQSQRDAIDSRDENLLVSAGAGSGKTAVMTERIASLILQGTDLKNMLVVTFTNAAASEMKRRFQMRLAEIARDTEQNSKVRMRARDQMETFSQANISTLHSFCTQVLRRHFHEVDLDPAFRVADEYEAAILRREAIDEVAETLFNADDVNFLALDDAFGDRYDGLEQLLLRVYLFMMTLPEPWEWLQQATELYDMTEEKLSAHPIYKLFCKQAEDQLNQSVIWLEQARTLLPDDPAYDKLRAQLDNECMRVRGAAFQLQQGMLTRLEKKSEIFATFRFPTQKDIPLAPKDAIKNLRDDAKLIWESLEKQNWSSAYQANKMYDMLPALSGLEKALKQFAQLYSEKKREKSLVDFADLEHFTLAVLRNADVAEAYKQRFDYVFVDEYQDSNAVQEAIVSYVSRDNNLFCVGDSKQSIYRFRAADPSLFLDRAKRYQEEQLGRVIPLNKNFRSQVNILHSVNDIFRLAMPRGEEQTYNEEDMLYAGRGEQEDVRPTSIYLLEKEWEESEEAASDKQEINAIQVEALQIVQCIRERLGKPIFDAKQNAMRPTTYRDFAILLRTVRSSSEVISRTLSEQGIPSYADLSGGYFDALEIQVFMDLLRLLDNRDQDLPWLSVIRAGFFGFSDEDLITIRAQAKKQSLFEAIALQAQEDNDTGKRCRKVLCFLEESKERALAMRLSHLIEWMLDQTQYFAMIAAQSGAKQRKANMEAFLKLAQTYEAVAARGLNGFLAFLDGFQEAGEDKGEARLSGEGADCVRIISIHKSKGLEYPIVFVAQCGKQRNQIDQRQKVLLHRRKGIGVKFVNTTKRLIGETLPWMMIRDTLEKESIAEELRVLYVAMTRAMNELILIGSVKNVEKSILKWQEQQSNQTMLDFIMGSLMQLDAANDWKEQYGISSGWQEANGQWNIQTVPRMALSSNDYSLDWKAHLNELIEKSKDQDIANIAERLQWAYQYESLPSKVTVSSLSHGRITLDTTPRFLLPKRMTAADRGVIMHTFLQHVDWTTSLDAANIKAQAGELVKKEIFSEEEAEALEISLLEKFFRSPLSQRMIQAKVRYREMPFTMQAKASEVYQDAGDGIISIQGVIDACFLEENEWILLDYKTDFVKGEGAEANFEAAKKHALQLSLYAEALTKVTGKAVRERWIVLLSVCEAIQIPNDTAFERPAYHHDLLHDINEMQGK